MIVRLQRRLQMAIRLEMDLAADNPIPLYGRGGKASHGLFYKLIADLDPELAASLHSMDDIKPFTTAFRGRLIHENRRWLIPAAEPFTIILTGMDFGMEEAIGVTAWRLSSNREAVMISGVRDVRILPDGIRIEQCSARELLERAQPAQRIGMSFDTPTAFRKSGKHLLFPLPENVFGSLARKWNAFGDECLEIDPDRIADSIMVQQFNIRTAMLEFGSFRQIGFIGNVTFDLSDLDREHRRVIALLAEWARFAGIGAKTTMGMGQSRLLSE